MFQSPQQVAGGLPRNWFHRGYAEISYWAQGTPEPSLSGNPRSGNFGSAESTSLSLAADDGFGSIFGGEPPTVYIAGFAWVDDLCGTPGAKLTTGMSCLQTLTNANAPRWNSGARMTPAWVGISVWNLFADGLGSVNDEAAHHLSPLLGALWWTAVRQFCRGHYHPR